MQISALKGIKNPPFYKKEKAGTKSPLLSPPPLPPPQPLKLSRLPDIKTAPQTQTFLRGESNFFFCRMLSIHIDFLNESDEDLLYAQKQIKLYHTNFCQVLKLKPEDSKEDKELIHLMETFALLNKFTSISELKENWKKWWIDAFQLWQENSPHPQKAQRIQNLTKLFLTSWDIDPSLHTIYKLLIDIEFNPLTPSQIHTRLKMIEAYLTKFEEQNPEDVAKHYDATFSMLKESLQTAHQQLIFRPFPKSVKCPVAPPPRTPSDCAVHFLYAVKQQQKQELPAHAKKFLETLEQQLKRHFYKHDLTVPHLRLWLETTEESCLKHFPNLSELCTTLLKQLPDDDKKIASPQHFDNFYGRVWDSALVKALVENPPLEVLKATQIAGQCFAEYLKEFDESLVLESAENTFLSFNRDFRFWMNKDKELFKLMKDYPLSCTSLFTYFTQEKKDGIACIALHYMISSFSLELQSLVKKHQISEDVIPTPWLPRADICTDQLIIPLRARLRWGDISLKDEKISIPFIQEKDFKGGITLHHQPAVIYSDHTASIRPSTRYKVAFEAYNTFTLSHGVPWGSGVSGTTCMQLHFLAHLQAKNIKINKLAYFQAVIMFLIYDGGHSLAEALFTAHLLEQKEHFLKIFEKTREEDSEEVEEYLSRPWYKDLDLDFGLNEGVAPEKFIADYQKFFDLYRDGSMHQAAEKAWETTLEYFEKYSSFTG